MTRRKIEYWVIPPQADAEFVAQEQVHLHTIRLALSCVADEQSKTCSPASRRRVPAVTTYFSVQRTAGVGRRRPGPGGRRRTGRWRSPACWKDATPQCTTITLVCGNLNTQGEGAPRGLAYDVRADPGTARFVAEFATAPKHGSWLNIAERTECRANAGKGDLGDEGVVHDAMALRRCGQKRRSCKPSPRRLLM